MNQCKHCGSMDDERAQCEPIHTDTYAQECTRKHTMHPHYSSTTGWIMQWAWGPASQYDGRSYP